jgi:hypothetical protein
MTASPIWLFEVPLIIRDPRPAADAARGTVVAALAVGGRFIQTLRSILCIAKHY